MNDGGVLLLLFIFYTPAQLITEEEHSKRGEEDRRLPPLSRWGRVLSKHGVAVESNPLLRAGKINL